MLSLGVLRFLLGLGESANWPAGSKAIAEWLPQERRGFAMGFFDAGSAVGAILAPPMVAALAILWGWRMAFVVTGLIGLLWLAAWLVIYRAPAEHPWLSEEERRIVVTGAATAPASPARRRWALGRIIGWRQLWGLMATRMIATPVWWFYVFWLPDYLGSYRGFSLKEIGMFGWIPFFTVDLGKLSGGACSDFLLRCGFSPTLARKGVMTLGALAMTSGTQVAGAASAAGALAWVCLATFGFGIWSANILALHADIFPSETMATAVGLTGMAASLGGALFSFATGAVVDRYSYAPAFWAAGLAPLAACAALFFWVGRVGRRHAT